MSRGWLPSLQRTPRIFVDMDGVIVDFDAYRDARGLTGDQVKACQGAYLDMEPIPGAIAALQTLVGLGFDVWLATKPPTGVAHAYSDKAAWVVKYLPFLKRKLVITHHKGMLGDRNDYLVDDRPHKAFCHEFKGTLVSFADGYHWPQALVFFRQEAARLKGRLGDTPAAADPVLQEVVQRLQHRHPDLGAGVAAELAADVFELAAAVAEGQDAHPIPVSGRAAQALGRYRALATHLGGCTDGGCVVVRPKGMHTNGGCKCPDDRLKARRVMQAAWMLADALEGDVEAGSAGGEAGALR